VLELSSHYVDEVVSSRSPLNGQGPVERFSETRENTPLVKLKAQLKDQDRMRSICQRITFEICADLIANEMAEIFRNVKLPNQKPKN
jgi:hypothetical protein